MTGRDRSQSTLLWVVAGTGAAVLGAAILFQWFRAQPGTAAEESKRPTANDATSGKSRVNTSGSQSKNAALSSNEAAAWVSHNGKKLVISEDEVAEECKRQVGKSVLDSMINRAIIQIACQERGVQVAQAEVDQEIVRIAKEFKIDAEQWLQMLQAERGFSPEQYRRDVIWPMLALKKLASEDIKVTAKEVQTAFEREYGPRVKARMILFDNLRRAQTAWTKVKEDPENFEKYVQEFSVDPTSKSLDGSIPPIPRNSGSPNLEQAAFKLKLGEISAIIQLDGGLDRHVILKCEGRTEPVVNELDDQVRAELEDQLKKQKVQEQVAKIFENIRKETRVDNFYTKTSTGDPKRNTTVRADGPKTGGTRSTIPQPATKPTPNESNTSPILQTSGQGTTTSRVKPAATTTDEPDELDLTPPRATPRRSTTTSNK